MRKKSLFLEGPSQVGKSTLLLESLQPYASVVGGFMVQRLWQGEQLKAFCLREVDGQLWPVNTAYQGHETHIFLAEQDGVWQSYPQVFRQMAARIPLITRDKGLLLFDEIGGVELLCEPFYEQLDKALSGNTPCIGVVKSAANSKMLCDNVAVAECYQNLYQRLITDIQGRFQGRIIELTEANRQSVRGQISDFLHGQAILK